MRFVWFLLAVCAHAQLVTTLGTSPPGKASLKDVSWIVGDWRGVGIDGQPAHEVWLPPAGGAMPGLFRQTKGDAVYFYEIMTIVEQEGSLVFRLKHFHADLKGWEEKDQTQDFRLVRVDEKGAWFDGLSMLRDGSDGLIAAVHVKSKDGKVRELSLRYKRAR